MDLKPTETKLVGQWIFNGKNIDKDAVCKRIEHLTKNVLKKIATDESGWNILYQDPNDNRHWQLLYTNSDLQGGGPLVLEFVKEDDVKLFYVVEKQKDNSTLDEE